MARVSLRQLAQKAPTLVLAFCVGRLKIKEVASRVRKLGTVVAAQESTARVATVDQLARDVAAAIRNASDGIIAAMRPRFFKAMTVVQTA